jgi:hypothetical protein
MSPRDKFDRFMADVHNGTNFKLARLSHAHFRAFFAAVVPIAAMSKVRGAFMVNGKPATPEDMRVKAPSLTLAECRSALEVFRECGMLEHDEELGGEWVHDFEEWNPEPRRAAKNAERQKRYRDRQKASHNGIRNVTRNVTHNGPVTDSNPPEVEVEEELPRNAPRGETQNGRLITFRRRPVNSDALTLAEAILADFNQQAGTNYGAYTGDGRASEDLKRILGAISDATPPLSLAEAARITQWRLKHPFWEGRPHSGVVFGPNVFPANRESVRAPTTNTPSSRDIANAMNRASTEPAA